MLGIGDLLFGAVQAFGISLAGFFIGIIGISGAKQVFNKEVDVGWGIIIMAAAFMLVLTVLLYHYDLIHVRTDVRY